MSFLSSLLLKFCFLHYLIEIVLFANFGSVISMKLFFSNFVIFFCLFFWPLTVESRAIPSTRDKFGLEKQERVCLYINCAEGEECVARDGIPHCQRSEISTAPPTNPPCIPEPCEAVTPVCDQFGRSYPSQCDLKSAACNSSQQLTATPCSQAVAEDCYSRIRSLLPSYSPPSPSQLADWGDLADAGALSYSHLSRHALPTCEANGGFKQEQCYSSIPERLFCWCVTPSNGVYVQGTFQNGRTDCQNLVTRNCSLRTQSGRLERLEHGEMLRDSCAIHTCRNGQIVSRPDDACSRCPPDQLAEAKRTFFSRKGSIYQNATGWNPNVRTRHALNWYFRRCDRNRGGEITYREFFRCHRRILQVSTDCMDAVFQNCSGPNSDSILPAQWRRCFMDSLAPPPQT